MFQVFLDSRDGEKTKKALEVWPKTSNSKNKQRVASVKRHGFVIPMIEEITLLLGILKGSDCVLQVQGIIFLSLFENQFSKLLLLGFLNYV